ncbi:hypothetical protein BDV32DRAFT_75099 [Aspergillus pseudonomiae]|uniref:Uncharacterized protein n=1 Tax=Aspergillus pseudonomiae TaxID=1506151 RepID=A0A5N7D815_9EURO|nr:uncharacterized protein BDV37DRAFT_253814 [Aspergillus pseudonomiae]KAB8264746.1 hypothetical protein BDV32DRAFT_75099 [Aspergillus pseudonomiae]KAE8401898.1 hypothetical protein BDV37DRAFT_253814 [Aspergillus pseudonomiae]
MTYTASTSSCCLPLMMPCTYCFTSNHRLLNPRPDYPLTKRAPIGWHLYSLIILHRKGKEGRSYGPGIWGKKAHTEQDQYKARLDATSVPRYRHGAPCILAKIRH